MREFACAKLDLVTLRLIKRSAVSVRLRKLCRVVLDAGLVFAIADVEAISVYRAQRTAFCVLFLGRTVFQ
jgi:hypothetical protein